MLSILNRIRRFSKGAQLPSHWYNPAARPGAPILVLTVPALHTCPNRKMNVQWWTKDTPAVVGVLSPTVCQDEQLQDSQSIFGFNIETGSSYLPDCSGDISWDTIRCSTEEGGDINGLILSPSASSSASLITLKSGNFSDYCSSNASDSNLTMVITDEDDEETFYFPAAQSPEWDDEQYDVATALVPEELLTTEGESEKIIPFGDGFPPRRASTITRLVGNAIRDRRSRSRAIADDIFYAENSIKPYRCGRSRRYSPHILTTIMEDRDEE